MINLFGTNTSGNLIQKYVAEKEIIYRNLCHKSDLSLADGSEKFFEFLLNNKIPFTIATASILDNVKFYFQRLNLAKWFDMDKVVYDNGKIKSKPSGEFFLNAAKNLNININETLVFEDSYNGIMSAENAGAGKIIIVDSCNLDYKKWSYNKIKTFSDSSLISLFRT